MIQKCTNMAKIARGLVIEMVLTKAVDNHMKAAEKHDSKGMEEAVSLIKVQTDFLVDSTNNLIGLSDLDICIPLMRYARKLLP